MAERDALREALRKIVSAVEGEFYQSLSETRIADIARAFLPPEEQAGG